MLPDFSCPKVTVIHCGAHRVTRGVFCRRSGGLQCEAHDATELAVESDSGADWVERTCFAIGALRAQGAKEIPAVLVLPPQAVLVKHWRTPRVDARKRAKIVAFGAGQQIPHALNEVTWDSMVSGEGASTQDLLLAAAKLGLIEPLCAAARAAGFALQRIVPASVALLAVYRLGRAERSESELILNIDEGAATLVQLLGRSFSIRSFLLGGTDATEPDALGEKIASEANRSILFFERQCDMPPPTGLMLAGEELPSVAVGRALQERLKIPVQAWEAGASVTFAPGVNAAGFPWVLGGAAAMQLCPAQVGVNLLPPRLRTQQRRIRRQPWLAAAALLALATPVAPLVHFHRLAAAAEIRLVEMDAIIAPLRLREDRIRAHLVRLAELERLISAGHAVRERRTVWLQLMADLQERLTGVQDVWFERMRIVPAAKDAPLKLAVTGCMLARSEPSGETGFVAMKRVQSLVTALSESPFVGAVESERFDGSRPGLLTFELILVMDGTPLM